MSIQEHLNKIRNAIKGSEVRESIAKGIETAYDDASENGNANMEVKIARGTHPNLRSRLEEVDSKQQQTTAQLAQTHREATRKRELEDLSPTVISAIEGGEGTSFNLMTIPQNKSVDVDKLTDDLGNALPLEVDTEWEIGTLVGRDGSEMPATNRLRTKEFIKVDRGSISSSEGVWFRVAFFSTEDMVLQSMSGYVSDLSITEPCYIKVLGAFTNGSDVTEANKQTLINGINISVLSLPKTSVSYDQLEHNIKTFLPINSTSGSTHSWEVGTFLPDGSLETSDSRIRTADFIEVKKSTVINLNKETMFALYIYNLDGTFKRATRFMYGKNTIEEHCLIKILVAYVDNRALTVDDIPTLSSSVKIDEAKESDVQDDNSLQITATNLMKNSDGSQGTEHWIASGIENYNGWITRYIAEPSLADYTIDQNLRNVVKEGHVYYLSSHFNVFDDGGASTIRFGFYGDLVGDTSAVYEGQTRLYKTFRADTSLTNMRGRFYFSPTDATSPVRFGIRYVTLIDLTEIFGKGKEPSADAFDQIMESFPNNWFGGTQTTALSNLDIYNSIQNKASTYQFFDDIQGVYETEGVETFPDPVNVKVADVYAKIDSLTINHPEYVAKGVLGQDEEGLDLVAYTFSPHSIPTNIKQKKLKVIFITGTHGDEKSPVFSAYNMFKKICEGWETHSILEFIRFNIEIIWVPIANPSGFNRHSRYNFNGVDLNRDFPPVQKDTRQLSTQHIMTIIEENLDAEYFVDSHNMNFGNGYMSYALTDDEKLNQQYSRMISTLGRKWQKKHSFIPQESDHSFGYVKGDMDGTISKYANTKGLRNILIEIVRQIEWEPNWQQYDELVIKSGTDLAVNTFKALVKGL